MDSHICKKTYNSSNKTVNFNVNTTANNIVNYNIQIKSKYLSVKQFSIKLRIKFSLRANLKTNLTIMSLNFLTSNSLFVFEAAEVNNNFQIEC